MGGGPTTTAGNVRLRAVLTCVAVAAATLLPLTWPDGRDSFPLSPYPMFAAERPDASVVLVVALGDGPAGSVVLPTEATGHRHLTQAVKALARSAAASGERPARLCVEIADWVRRTERTDVERVRIVTAAYDGIEYLVHDERTPEVRAVHATCEVER